MNRIAIVPYTSEWPSTYRKLRSVYRIHLSGLYDAIEHVGSTSVPGLASKHILDIDIVVRDTASLKRVTTVLETLGYRCAGERGIPGRYAFDRLHPGVPEDGNGTTWMTHHLYVCIAGSESLTNHLAFRGYLRKHAWAAQQYQELKYRLAAASPFDMEDYVSEKTGFITKVLRKQRLSDSAIGNISRQNIAQKSLKNRPTVFRLL